MRNIIHAHTKTCTTHGDNEHTMCVNAYIIHPCATEYTQTKKHARINTRTRYRVAKTHRMPYLYGSFYAKEPYN